MGNEKEGKVTLDGKGLNFHGITIGLITQVNNNKEIN
jgi:hypothetical protein